MSENSGVFIISDDQTWLSEWCRPHLSSRGWVDGADVAEIAPLSQSLQFTLYDVQPLLIRHFSGGVFELLHGCGRISGPEDVRSRINFVRGALDLLITAQTSDLEIHRADRSWKEEAMEKSTVKLHRVKFTHSNSTAFMRSGFWLVRRGVLCSWMLQITALIRFYSHPQELVRQMIHVLGLNVSNCRYGDTF